MVGAQGHAGGHGVAAELVQHFRVGGGHRVQHVAQVQAGYRAAGALEHALLAGRGEGDHRPVHRLLDPRGEDAHHPFVPVRPVQAQRGGQLALAQPRHFQHGGVAHALLDAAPLPVDGVQLFGEAARLFLAVRQQAFDAVAHVGEAAGGVEARPGGEAQVRRHYFGRVAAGHAQQGAQAGAALAGADAAQALLHQDAVGVVQDHHVGHGAQGHQVQQVEHRAFDAQAALHRQQ